jgi:hypothetical protein
MSTTPDVSGFLELVALLSAYGLVCYLAGRRAVVRGRARRRGGYMARPRASSSMNRRTVAAPRTFTGCKQAGRKSAGLAGLAIILRQSRRTARGSSTTGRSAASEMAGFPGLHATTAAYDDWFAG